jgi:hypoxanthine phosphoribosyltransferase
MVKKVHYTWKDVEHMINVLVNLMYADNWRPDYIVGLTRGGLVPTAIMSNITGIKCHTLDTRSDNQESNCWMAEDAFGYVYSDDRDKVWGEAFSDPSSKKKILILDDLNNTGNSFKFIKNDWQSGCLPDNPNWDTIWHDNVRFATLVDNGASEFKDTDYTAVEINKDEEGVWVVFPWESERDYGNF